MVMIDSGISKVLQAADQCMINRYSHQLNVSDQFFFTKTGLVLHVAASVQVCVW